MPDIKLRNQPFDLVFHPDEPVVYASLLTGEVKAWRYDDTTGETERAWSVRPTKRTARALAVEADGKGLWMGGKSGILCRLDASQGTVTRETDIAHDAPINRVCCVNEQLVASGDDNGVIQFWDTRKPGDAIRKYEQHYDYISGFAYFEDKRQLIATSGDGHLSCIDIRSSKPQPLSVSEDQEDELLSIVPIKGDTKCVVGTGLGILGVWNRKSGWGDVVDRIPGHPASVDALVALTPDIVATGSEDGLVRVMQILPNKFLGVIATHDDYPIERLALDRNKKWLGSVSHDECIKLTDVEDLFEESDDEGGDDVAMDEDSDAEGAAVEGEDADDAEEGEDAEEMDEDDDDDDDSDSDVEMRMPKARNPGKDFKKAVANAAPEVEERGFFDDL